MTRPSLSRGLVRERCYGVFKALGNLPRWDWAKPNGLTTRPGLLAHAGPRTHRREFPPVIPQRVAPQQSPLPLHRIGCLYVVTGRARNPPRSQWRWFAKQIELQIVSLGLEGLAVTADLGQVRCLEFQGKLHQRIGDISCSFVGHGAVR
jgi:hypothetical protein